MDDDLQRRALLALARLTAAIASATTDEELQAAIGGAAGSLGSGDGLAIVPAQTSLPGVPPPPPPEGAKAKRRRIARETAARIFAYWQQVFDHPRAVFGPERERLIVARLEQGYSEGDIRRAIDGVAGSDLDVYKDHHDLTLICRDSSHVERYMGMAGAGGAGGGEVPTRPEKPKDPAIEELNALARKALKEGRHADYERYQRQLREKMHGN